MISLSQLNKLIQIVIFFSLVVFNSSLATTAEDIWKKKESNGQDDKPNDLEEEIIIKSPILTDEVDQIKIKISEKTIEKSKENIVGIFDPEENNFTLDLWSYSDGLDVKQILKRIDKIKLSKSSEDLLFKVLFTNAYPPKTNLSSDEFVKIKVDWLIKNRRLKDLENLLKNNQEVGKHPNAIKFLIDEYLSSANIKSACEKTNFISREIQNNYLDKFTIYCLINNDRKEEAQLIFDLAKERGFKDKFFENKVNFLLGVIEKSDNKILDNNLLNFYLSHITSNKFEYLPNDKTDKHIWKYLSSANLIKTDDLESEEIILTYEKAAANNSFEKQEIFKIYLKLNFNFNQLKNAKEIYKNLPNYKSRALIYQSMMLSNANEQKIELALLLKNLFEKDKIYKVYEEEFLNVLKSIDTNKISSTYAELIDRNLEESLKSLKKIKFNNDIIHRSKVIKHFIDNNDKNSRTEKDFKSVYKKIKKNKKYFISIKDIVVLESLEYDGVVLPKDLNFGQLSSDLTVPKNLEDLAKKQQTGLVVLKIVEIIGEDRIEDLDPETIYFLNRILNQLDLKKIRNNILSEALPQRI